MPPAERLTAALAGVAFGAASAVACGAAAAARAAAAAATAPAADDNNIDALRERYRRDGFVKLPALLSAEELESWREALARGLTQQLERSQGKYHEGGTSDEVDVASGDYANQGEDAGYYRTVFIQAVNMWKKSPAIKSLLFDGLAPRLRSLVAQIAGCDAGYKLYHDHCLIKQPWASPTNWHTDQQMDPYWDERATMLWISLDAATPNNGALCFLPGTHKQAKREAPTAIDEGFGDEGVGAMLLTRPEWAGIDPVCVTTQPGDAILIDPMVAHAAVRWLSCVVSLRAVRAMRALLSCPVLSCPVLSCPVLPCPALPCPALPCPVLSCPVLSGPIRSGPGMANLHRPHRTALQGANMTNKHRRAYAMLLMPNGARYNGQPAALPGHLAKRLERGEEILDDEHLPPF
jgi:phytanoyl-CoA hydroxylase